jgi:hypothetical protein
MSTRSKQIAAAVLALSAADVGGWATFAPRSFFTSFPLPGHHWLTALAPYNEHLTRDVGGLYLALLVLSAWAGLRPHPETFRITGAAWLAFSVPHLAFHLLHLGMYDFADKVGNVLTLGGTVLLAALLLVPAAKSDQPSEASAANS